MGHGLLSSPQVALIGCLGMLKTWRLGSKSEYPRQQFKKCAYTHDATSELHSITSTTTQTTSKPSHCKYKEQHLVKLWRNWQGCIKRITHGIGDIAPALFGKHNWSHHLSSGVTSARLNSSISCTHTAESSSILLCGVGSSCLSLQHGDSRHAPLHSVFYMHLTN